MVELKRPSLVIGDRELTQVKTYARTLSKHPALGASKWTFWLVGAEIGDDIEEDVNQVDREQGHAVKAKNYDIAQEAATERVRQRHGELLPTEVQPTLKRRKRRAS